MSIIHDALKKVQNSLSRKHGRQIREDPPPAQPAAVEPTPQPEQVPAQPTYQQHRLNTSPTPKETSSSSHKTIYVMAYGILIAVAIIVILVLRLLDQPQMATQPSALVQQRLATVPAASQQTTAPAAETPVQKVVRAVTRAPTPKPAVHSDELMLNGTMLMDNRRVALINEDIYELGDTIEGKKIIDITLKEVSLLNEKDGSIIKLKVKNRR